MRVYSNHNPLEVRDPIAHLGFEKLSALGLGGEDVDFFYGGHPNNFIYYPSDRRKIFFSTEEQSWENDTTDRCINEVEKILTICPPSVTKRQKRELCFFPFNKEHIPKKWDKKYDVIYTGLAMGPHIEEILSAMVNFNYRFASFGSDRRITNYDVSYFEKLELISESKVCVVHNLTGTGTPQVKTRIQEAAIGKSIMLCKHDPWNVIENFFEPEKEFFYFNSQADLQEKISEIVKNYGSYQNVAEAAFQKAVNNYTSEHFIKKYLQ